MCGIFVGVSCVVSPFTLIGTAMSLFGWHKNRLHGQGYVRGDILHVRMDQYCYYFKFVSPAPRNGKVHLICYQMIETWSPEYVNEQQFVFHKIEERDADFLRYTRLYKKSQLSPAEITLYEDWVAGHSMRGAC